MTSLAVMIMKLLVFGVGVVVFVRVLISNGWVPAVVIHHGQVDAFSIREAL